MADFERLLAPGALDILQPEIAKVGGPTPARWVGELAHCTNVAVYPHNYSVGPSLLANIRGELTMPGARLLELPWLPEGQHFPCGLAMPELVDGCVLPPGAPGVGFGR